MKGLGDCWGLIPKYQNQNREGVTMTAKPKAKGFREKLEDVYGFLTRLLADLEDNDPDSQWRKQIEEVNEDLFRFLGKAK